MTTLTADISATQTLIPVSEPVDEIATYPLWATIDDETVRLLGRSENEWSVMRGVAGSTAVGHLSGTDIVRYYPDAPGGEGGGLTDTSLVSYTSAAGVYLSAGVDVAGGGAASASLARGEDGGGGSGFFQAGSGIAGEPGGDFTFEAGLGDVTADTGASVVLTGGDGEGVHGRINIRTANVSGAVGDVLTAQGDGTAIWAALSGATLPTADPVVAGALWNDAGVVKVSAG